MNINGKKGSISNVLLIIISALVLLIAIIFYVYVNNNNSSSISSEDLTKWVGLYNSDNNDDANIEISICDKNTLRTKLSNSLNHSLHIEEILCTPKNNKISYEISILGKDNNVEITQENGKLIVKASSSDADNVLNTMNGTYTKADFKDLGWTGLYTNDDNVMLILSEISENNITFSLEKENSSVEKTLESYTDSEITYTSSSDDEEITIEKTDNGIKVEASSSDPESILNEISGEYSRL